MPSTILPYDSAYVWVHIHKHLRLLDCTISVVPSLFKLLIIGTLGVIKLFCITTLYSLCRTFPLKEVVELNCAVAIFQYP